MTWQRTRPQGTSYFSYWHRPFSNARKSNLDGTPITLKWFGHGVHAQQSLELKIHHCTVNFFVCVAYNVDAIFLTNPDKSKTTIYKIRRLDGRLVTTPKITQDVRATMYWGIDEEVAKELNERLEWV